MKKIICVLPIFFCVLFAQEMTNVVATVNGEKITKEELDRAVEAYIPRNYIHGSVTGEKRKEAEDKALEEVIEKELFYQEAKRLGLKVNQKELEVYRAKVITFFGSEEKFEKALKRARMSKEDFFDIFRKKSLVQKLNDEKIKVSYTDEEIRKYYDENSAKFIEPEKLKVRMIYVQINPSEINATAVAKSRITEAYEKVQNGEDFAFIASKYSHDRSRVKGGDLGYLHKGMLDRELEDAIEKLEKGEVSGIVHVVKGFAIVKLEEKSLPRKFSYEEIKDKLKKDKTAAEQKRKKEELLRRLKDNANIVYTAR